MMRSRIIKNEEKKWFTHAIYIAEIIIIIYVRALIRIYYDNLHFAGKSLIAKIDKYHMHIFARSHDQSSIAEVKKRRRWWEKRKERGKALVSVYIMHIVIVYSEKQTNREREVK